MWKRKDLKDKAKIVVKKNYWTAIVVCFILALFTSEFGTSIIGIWQSSDSMDPYYLLKTQDINGKISENIAEKIKEIKENSKGIELTDIQSKLFSIINDNLNSATKAQKYIVKVFDAITSFEIQNEELGIQLSILAIVAFIFVILVAEPLIVAGRRYFLKARNSNAKIGVLGDIFKKKNWINVVIVMLFKKIYTFLWMLTIVGGIIKIYEYSMIPYILAENPKIKRKQAFKLSKQMMKGNKWRKFILDISFLPWNILSIFTFGLLNILYVNPYIAATNAELYMLLREQAIENKYEYFEELNNKTLNSSN